MRYLCLEACAYNALGRIALKEGTGEIARMAVVHFENELKVYEAVGDIEGIAGARTNIAAAKSQLEGGCSEGLLKTSREMYELQVAKHGEEHEATIRAGKLYSFNLRSSNRRVEARELLTKLLATSMQVLGPHHNITKNIELSLHQRWWQEEWGSNGAA